MRVSIETTSGLERRLTVGVPADRVDTAVDKRLQEAARNVRLPGSVRAKSPCGSCNSDLARVSDKRCSVR